MSFKVTPSGRRQHLLSIEKNFGVGEDGFGQEIWNKWNDERRFAMEWCKRGDQEYIEKVYSPAIIQDAVPPGYFLHYRDLTHDSTPTGASVIVFGGRNKPHNSPYHWIKRAWKI